jgi:hypothetical protein
MVKDKPTISFLPQGIARSVMSWKVSPVSVGFLGENEEAMAGRSQTMSLKDRIGPGIVDISVPGNISEI